MSRRQSKRFKKSQRKGSPAWMTSYADMMTLLLVFFILLFSMSIIDIQKFTEAIQSFNLAVTGSPGVFVTEPSPIDVQTQLSEAEDELPEPGALYEQGVDISSEFSVPTRQVQEMEQLRDQLEEHLADAGFEGQVEMDMTPRGLALRLIEDTFFDRGSAELKPEVKQMVALVAKDLREAGHNIRVEGFSCDLPISTPQHPSNWELSVDRSITVLRFLIEESKIEPDKLSAAGYGEYAPLKPNTTEENRAKNRRVDVIVLFPALQIHEPDRLPFEESE